MAGARIRPQLNLAWRGSSLLITNHLGEVGAEPLNGFYFREARHLSRIAFEIGGHAAHLCSIHTPAPPDLYLVAIHPELEHFSGGGTGESGQMPTPVVHGIPARAIQLRTHYEVRPASLVVTTVLENRAAQDVQLTLGWVLAADFADLLEVMDGQTLTPAAVDQHAHELRFRDRRLPLETHVRAGPGEWLWHDDRLERTLELAAGAAQEIVLVVQAIDRAEPLGPRGEEARLRAAAQWQATLTKVFMPADAPFAAAAAAGMRDVGSLALLEGKPDEWLAPAAAMPLYPALFARDALTVGWQSLLFDRGEVLDAALTVVGRLQGTVVDPARDEEPGRIIQQARRGPLARLGKNPFARYYGDFASPFDFVMYLGQLFAWSGDRVQLDRHWDTARRVMDWARDYADPDADGFLEYCTRSPSGPVHQGWKDSGRAIVDAEGREVKPPLAVAEVQGYYFAAQQTMAALSLVQHDRHAARDWWQSAQRLKDAFNRDFWLEDEGFPALALDSGKRIVPTIASDAGQCLATGIVSDEHLPRLVRRLFEPDLFTGWGIRTLSSRHPSYDPLSYHLGSVWPVENGTIVFGLRRFGFVDRTLELATSLYDLSLLYDGFRVPECVGGYAREAFPHPGAYPQANAPQAWNQSVPGIVLQSLLGMFPLAIAHTLMVDPALPAWLPMLELRGLRVGSARVSLRFERTAKGTTDYDVLEKTGELHIVRQPPVEALGVGWLDRLGAFVKSSW